MFSSKLSLLSLASIALLASLLACQNEGDSSAEDSDLTAFVDEDDAPAPSPEELLKEAVTLARGGCSGGGDAVHLASLLREATGADDSDAFRAKIAQEPALLKVLGDTFAWREITGVYDPSKPETLVAALDGLTLWTAPGADGFSTGRVHLRKGGKATLFVLDAPDDAVAAPKDAKFTEEATTWSLDADGTLHIGEDILRVHQGRELMLTRVGDLRPAFYSLHRACPTAAP